MNIENLKKLNLNHVSIDEIVEDAIRDMNPLRAIISDQFNAPDDTCYRERSINKVIKCGVTFTSECNTLTELASKLIVAKNPYNGNEMVYNGGGGNAQNTTINFIDKTTGDEVSISLSHDAITVTPSNKS